MRYQSFQTVCKSAISYTNKENAACTDQYYDVDI